MSSSCIIGPKGENEQAYETSAIACSESESDTSCDGPLRHEVDSGNCKDHKDPRSDEEGLVSVGEGKEG